jgi:hypothetical protein
MKQTTNIRTIEEYLGVIDEIISSWRILDFVWFRGQPVDKELKPKVYRQYNYDEISMMQTFRLKAKSLGETPSFYEPDEWLFLMQHYGLPTRLLDWTESSLIALFFALDFNNVKRAERNPVIWVLNPLELNSISVNDRKIQLTGTRNITDYFLLPFGEGVEHNDGSTNLPIAIATLHLDKRMSAQKSCFTIHGTNKDGADILFKNSLINNKFLFKIQIEKKYFNKMHEKLNSMGITYSTVFPDFDGLSKEIEEQFRLTNIDFIGKRNIDITRYSLT